MYVHSRFAFSVVMSGCKNQYRITTAWNVLARGFCVKYVVGNHHYPVCNDIIIIIIIIIIILSFM